MADTASLSQAPSASQPLAFWLDRTAFGLFIVVLAWAPFPLGSNRPWSWSLLILLVGVCWLLWWGSTWRAPAKAGRFARGLVWPLLFGGLALGWGIVQVLPIVPQGWSHPVWQLADSVLGTHGAGAISMDPWRTMTEVMKLTTYVMAFWLVRVFASRTDRANTLLNALIVIGGVYAAYALSMAAMGLHQFNLFYAAPDTDKMVAAPFVNRNSFATYAGLCALCAGARLVERGSAVIVTRRGPRVYLLTLVQYLFGSGVLYLLAGVLALSALIATASRAGNTAFDVGLAVIFVLSLILSARQSRLARTAGVAIAIFAAIVVLFAINGNVLATRIDDMTASGLDAGLRLHLWDVAWRMIQNSPFLGLGLGTYKTAYPLYSDLMTRFIIDRAHNDYLELAAGLGLPAAILWWSALVWLSGLCLRGVLVRRRYRVYPMVAVGASALVGFHSIFDFSLQMPAIALTYAAILGLGVAQAFSTRSTA